ncbi:MAG: Carbamate kinase 2 [Calditrichaeota bacterium]|nr:Carbamate kinase 2 [Calditrichota bacterium]
MADRPTAVVALGGNAISDPDAEEDIHSQFAQTRRSMGAIVSLLEAGYELALTHGNGPQIGYELIRVEKARGHAPVQPIGVLDAATEGWMGYMIEQSLMNRLVDERIDRKVVSLVTQVVVDRHDPALADPSKFIGPTYSRAQAEEKIEFEGWTVKEYSDGRWRRVVGSPIPREIVNASTIRRLLDAHHIVICAGGGGVPVYREPDGHLEGVDAVIDKDRASALLGTSIGARDLIIFTSVEKVALDFGEPDQRELARMTVTEGKRQLAGGQFPAGSMGPKIEAAIEFLEGGGERVIITDLEHARESVDGEAGTMITGV